MFNFIRNLSDNTRIYVYAFIYVAAFVLFISGLTLIVDIVHTYSSNPELVLLGGVVVFMIYLGISVAISSAKHRVEMEKFQEERVARKLGYDTQD